MSEQIREQVSAFLDGELPSTETELLLKRLTRDGELRESFGRYALIGEALRGGRHTRLTKGFASRVNLAIDGEPVPASGAEGLKPAARWWRPFAGAAVVAGVAAVAIVAMQQRSLAPGVGGSAAAIRVGGPGGYRLQCLHSGHLCSPDSGGKPRSDLLHGTGGVHQCAGRGAERAFDQLYVRPQQVFLRPRATRRAGGSADR
jgi:anti-sigma factor RsiW